MIRLTAARIAVAGAGLAAALGGVVAATATTGAPAIATLTAAQPTPSGSGSTNAPASAPHTKKHPLLELRLRRVLIEATAKATGQTVGQVREQLRAGRSLDDIAGGKAAEIKAAVLKDVRARVEQAVDGRKITQAQADKIVDRASAAIDRIMAAHRLPKAAPKATPAA